MESPSESSSSCQSRTSKSQICSFRRSDIPSELKAHRTTDIFWTSNNVLRFSLIHSIQASLATNKDLHGVSSPAQYALMYHQNMDVLFHPKPWINSSGSFMQVLKSSGKRTKPCGTPQKGVYSSEYNFYISIKREFTDIFHIIKHQKTSSKTGQYI